MKQQLVDAISDARARRYIDHNGHRSAAHANSFRINPASVRGALTVDDIVTSDLAGNLVEEPRAAARHRIHLRGLSRATRRQRRDATHPQWSTFPTMTV